MSLYLSPKKIYTTAYRLGMLNLHGKSDAEVAAGYKRLLLSLMQEITDKGLQLK